MVYRPKESESLQAWYISNLKMAESSRERMKKVVDCIEQALPTQKDDFPIQLHEPRFENTNALRYVQQSINSGWVSSGSEWVNRFESELCRITGSKHAVAVCNGTVALRLSLYIAGVRPGDEVLMSPISFIATANAVAHLGATPHFVDIDVDTLSISNYRLRERLREIAHLEDGKVINRVTGKRIASVLPVHVFGIAGNIDELKEICEEWKLPIIEDAAEALGSWRNQVHCGLFGKCGVISFNGNKIITTGGGGALITDSSFIAERARHLSTTAKLKHDWEYEHDEIGWNDRMPGLNAALGCAQLEVLEDLLDKKNRLFRRYLECFTDLKEAEIIVPPAAMKANNWLINLRLSNASTKELKERRQELVGLCYSKGIRVRPIWKPLNQQKMYEACPAGPLEAATKLALRIVSLPSSPHLGQALP